MKDVLKFKKRHWKHWLQISDSHGAGWNTFLASCLVSMPAAWGAAELQCCSCTFNYHCTTEKLFGILLHKWLRTPRMFTHLFFKSCNFLYYVKTKAFRLFLALCKCVLGIYSGLGFFPQWPPLASESLPCNNIKISNEQMITVLTIIFWFLHLWFALPAHPSYPTHKADFSASSTYFLYGWHFSGCQFHIVSKSAHLVLHFLL